VPQPIDPENVLDANARRAWRAQRRAEEAEKSEASGFSDAFAWANLKFDDLFKFQENTCAKKHLKVFKSALP
jgi:hypothetical protein